MINDSEEGSRLMKAKREEVRLQVSEQRMRKRRRLVATDA